MPEHIRWRQKTVRIGDLSFERQIAEVDAIWKGRRAGFASIGMSDGLTCPRWMFHYTYRKNCPNRRKRH
jgi:hypothetical protein